MRLFSVDRFKRALTLAFGMCVLGGAFQGCTNSRDTGESPDAVNASPWEEVPFSFVSAEIQGDDLMAVVSYGGGCGEHRWELLPHGPLLKSLPPKQPLRLVHRSSGDPCRALVLDTVITSLTPFRGSPHGTTVLLLADWDKDLLYTYH
jgi:hypothetical protein